MCDTIVALGSVTADGVTLFGKNSDREPNEAHHLLRVPRTRHSPGSTVKCTYLEIPQVEETYEVLLAKPFWIWGAEMGANEHGVTIGNEAVFAKIPYEKQPGLIGMDLLRLGLERGKTAREALNVITALLEQHGQGGNCGHTTHFEYYNSFIIADSSDAWVLETAGRQWVAEQVKGVRSISNRLTIGSEWDLASEGLVSYAVERGWCTGRDDFHFARCYSDWFYSTFSFAHGRQSCTANLLAGKKGKLTVADFTTILRDHGPSSAQARSDFNPAHGIVRSFVCQHFGFGPIRGYQSTGSMVSHLAPGKATHFLTATSAPCTSIFKPVWTDVDLPDSGPEPTDVHDGTSLWWRHEILHRATLRNYPQRIGLYAADRDALERGFIEGALACHAASSAERATFSAQCFARAEQAEAQWTERVLKSDGPDRWGPLYRTVWNAYNRRANMPELT